MSKKTYGVLSFIPVGCYLFLVLLFGIVEMSFLGGTVGMSDELFAMMVIVVLLVGIVAVISVCGVMILFIVNACKNPHFSTGRKAIWGIIMYFFNIFVFPVYWYQYIYKEWDEQRERRRPELSIFWVLTPVVLSVPVLPTLMMAGNAYGTAREDFWAIIFSVFFVFTLFFGFVALILFVVHACTNREISTKKRILWILFFIFFNAFAFALYWGIHVYVREQDITKTTLEFDEDSMKR